MRAWVAQGHGLFVQKRVSSDKDLESKPELVLSQVSLAPDLIRCQLSFLCFFSLFSFLFFFPSFYLPSLLLLVYILL
jgi:hypothetical protein